MVSYGETGNGRGEKSQSEGSDDTTSEEEEPRDVLETDTTLKEDRWDCESILRQGFHLCVHWTACVTIDTSCSTHSTLYNHPTRIVEPRTRVSVGQGEIKLSRKTGMPLGVIPGPLPKENHPKKGTYGLVVQWQLRPSTCTIGTVTRPKNEDGEEKRARRLAMKEDRKVG